MPRLHQREFILQERLLCAIKGSLLFLQHQLADDGGCSADNEMTSRIVQ